MSTKTSTQLKELWNRIADWYEQNSMKLTTRILYNYIHLPDYSKVNRILETGCGPGNSIPIILKYTKPTTELVCTDISEAQVSKASSKNIPRTQCLVADNECLPFEDQEFDLYISNMSLMMVSEPMNMLREAYRVTKPGSMSIFSLTGPESSCTYLGNLVSIINHYHEGPAQRNSFHLNDIERLKAMVKEVGYNKVYAYTSLIPLPCVSVEEMVEYYSKMPNIDEFRDTEKYESVLQALGEKTQDVLSSGSTVNFSFIVCIAIK